MTALSVKDLLESGVHFGHRVSRWNPKMEPFIFGKRNLIHIIDLRETIRGLIRASNFLQRLCADGREVLYVGTKRQAKAVVEAEARRSAMHYVTERWLGGTLTNFETITRRLHRLEELEAMEQDGRIGYMKKKEYAAFLREKRKLLRNLEGIRNMKHLPGAVIIIDPRREHIALKEANKLGIPTVCLIDTDSDPELVDIPIPGNDDAMRSIQVILHRLTDSVIEGNKISKTRQGIETKRVADEGGVAEPSAPPTGARRIVIRRVPGQAPAAKPGTEAEAPKPAPGAEAKPAAPESDGPAKPAAKTSAAEEEAKPAAEGEAKPAADGEAKPPAKEAPPVAEGETPPAADEEE